MAGARVWRSASACLWAGLWLHAAPAQGPGPGPRVVAFGQDADGPERVRTARTEEELRAIASAERLTLDAAVDFASEVAVVLWYGDGRGGRPNVAVLVDGAEDPRRLLRVAGPFGAPPARGRWVAIALSRSWEPWRRHLWFETDGTPIAGDAVWREVLAARAPALVVPLATVAGRLPVLALCFQELRAFRAFGEAQGLLPSVPDPDFSQEVLVAFAEAGPSLYMLRGEVGQDRHWTLLRRWRPEPEVAPPPSYAWFRLPRAVGAVDCEVPVPGKPGLLRVVLHTEVADLRTAPTLPLLRAFECGLAAEVVPQCARVTSLAAWRDLKQSLGGPVSKLADDWCDFEHDCIVVVVVAAARVLPGFLFGVAEEEGVDVLTLTQTAPSGRSGDLHAACAVLKVPRRKGQLAVVLRQEIAPAPGTECTLRVFPGF